MVKRVDMAMVEDLAKELKLEGRQKEADALDALVEMLSLPGGYYSSEEVAQKLNVSPEVVLLLVEKGILQGILVRDKVLIPQLELARYEETETLSQELDSLLANYAQDDIRHLVKEARREWQSRRLF